MLRVTLREHGEAAVLVVEGKLIGATLAPLAEMARKLPSRGEGTQQVVVDLMGVTSIDAEGKELLKQLHSLGASFRAKGCLNRAIVEGITCCAPEPAGAGERPERQAPGIEGGEEK
jgi:ABC-type transporter Mla MlaB component